LVRRIFLLTVLGILAINYILSVFVPAIWWDMIVFGPLILVGFIDLLQTKKAIRRNFPVLGNIRYLFEGIRPEINQYFIESNSSGMPFSREDRSVVYQRAKGELDTIPFGTQKDLYQVGYEWLNHSVHPVKPDPETMRITVGGPQCRARYRASVLNISAMSFGSLSRNAILALNEGAKIGGFAHNTGEGGLSRYHLAGGGDIIWQIGTGYFGCRTPDGKFDAVKFKDCSQLPQVKMIELKLSQGAKPGGGGILPAAKVSREIAEARGVEMGKDVLSPSRHSTFETPVELLEFISQLRELSGGKPVGFKLCVGKRHEFLAICKAMVKTGIVPDFITVDGSEGGTGAAPLEFSNYLGYPLTEGLIFIQNALVGFSLRDKLKIFASGKVTTGFGMVKRMALGADMIYSARAMMMAMGCIQAVTCNTNKCPVGISTQDEGLVVGLVVSEKNKRVAMFHKQTIKSFSQLLGAMGITHPSELRPWHIMRRVTFSDVKHYGRIYQFLNEGELLQEPQSDFYREAWKAASAESFGRSS
jgi:glutamate synthase domain-containing protein 2